MSLRWIGIAVACGLAAGCTSYETRTVVVQPGDDACLAYGFPAGTAEYRDCAQREAESRRRGRVDRTYGETRIMADAQESCSAYGLPRGSDRYDRCVQREIQYRRPG